jgi:hypothetical protein
MRRRVVVVVGGGEACVWRVWGVCRGLLTAASHYSQLCCSSVAALLQLCCSSVAALLQIC